MKRLFETSSSRRIWLQIAVIMACVGCQDQYRVGERVLVEWDGKIYPAFIIQKRGRARFRVHYDGYDARWDEDVTLDRIKGRASEDTQSPPPPDRVARASGVPSRPSAQAVVSPYKAGDRVRVRWRGSVYKARVIAVVAADRFLVHYDGHESAWDEIVPIERIVKR